MKENLLLLKESSETWRTKFVNIWPQHINFVYIDTVDDIVIGINNTYHRNFKMNPVDVKSSTYIDFNVENNEKSLILSC